jgi:hypothetical protein
MTGRAACAQPWRLPQRVATAGPGSLRVAGCGGWVGGKQRRPVRQRLHGCLSKTLGGEEDDGWGRLQRQQASQASRSSARASRYCQQQMHPRLDAGFLAGRVEGVACLWRYLVFEAASEGGIKGKMRVGGGGGRGERGGMAARRERESSPGFLRLLSTVHGPAKRK